MFDAAVRAVGLAPLNLVIQRGPTAGNSKSGRRKRAHPARTEGCCGAVIRKGRCEQASGIRELQTSHELLQRSLFADLKGSNWVPDTELGAQVRRQLLEPTATMLVTGAQRLVGAEGRSHWPDSKEPQGVVSGRNNETERVWRGMWEAVPVDEMRERRGAFGLRCEAAADEAAERGRIRDAIRKCAGKRTMSQ